MKTPVSLICTALCVGLSVFASRALAADAGALPYGWVNADISRKVINQGVDTPSVGLGVVLSPANSSAGYRVVQSHSLDLKLGVYGGWYRYAGTFASTLFGAGLTILPVDGSTVIADRFVKSAAQAASLTQTQIPAKAAALEDWSAHDSIFYDNRGGIIFSIGVGYLFTGLSGDYFAQGEWSTYIEKLDAQKVFVKITKISLHDFDLMLGNSAAAVLLSSFDKVDQMFSYVFDLSDPRAVVAYEAMIHGSLKEAENLAAQDPAVATLTMTENGLTDGHQTHFILGVPFLNASETSGRLHNFSDTVLHADQSRSDVDYGLYWSEGGTDVGLHHVSSASSFYGITYRTTYPTRGSFVSGRYAKIILSYENDQSDATTIPDMVAEMKRRTGLGSRLRVTAPTMRGEQGYTHLSLYMVVTEAATRQLAEPATDEKLARIQTDSIVLDYFNQMGDPDLLCDPSASSSAVVVNQCRLQYMSDTASAVDAMREALGQMRSMIETNDEAGFARAYGKFGQAMLKNRFSFSIASRLLTGNPLSITFEAEGAKIGQLTQVLN